MVNQAEQSAKLNPKLNHLLAKLEPDDYEHLMANATQVNLKFRKKLYRQDEAIDAVYFPLTSMVSLLVTTKDQPQMELATIGKEGVVGAAEILQEQGALGLNLIQIAGAAIRIPANKFITEMQKRPLMEKWIHRHMYALTRQILYGAACNRMHSMEERCALWLLMTNDRAGQETFQLTQEFLSHMLGVRRATVNVATGMLKKAGFITYVRGLLTVLDRPGLESASCHCYGDINRAYEMAMSHSDGKK